MSGDNFTSVQKELAKQYKYCWLKNATGAVCVPRNVKINEYKANADKILSYLANEPLPGLYCVYAGMLIKEDQAICKKVLISNLSEEDNTELEYMTQEQQISLVKRNAELEAEVRILTEKVAALEAELAEPMEEAPAPYAPLIGTLSEMLPVLMTRYFDHQDRRTAALEAAAAKPVTVAPAPAPTQSYQISRSYTPKPAPQAAAPGAAPGPTVNINPPAPGGGGGGVQTPTGSVVIPDNITESEYMEAIKHLTLDELRQYWDQVRKSGDRISMRYLIEVIKEVRPDDLMSIIEDESKL